MKKHIELILISVVVFLSGLTCILDYIFTIENGNIHIYIYDIGWINLAAIVLFMLVVWNKNDIN